MMMVLKIFMQLFVDVSDFCLLGGMGGGKDMCCDGYIVVVLDGIDGVVGYFDFVDQIDDVGDYDVVCCLIQ